ncbi:substrate-binding periplasmic protein [Dongshaea marina]|uniref:substrate-binding periplasmic protein n=1 Tax=Dongshaea marina TaxID=2047966 RepID=UPI000D3E99AD|nr:transporter substrate-binding domain-containing protein [Dongshaea marina]
MRTWLIALLSLLPALATAQPTMVMTYFDSYPPYSWKEKGQMKGILVDIATEALQNRMKLKVEHQGYPWARAQLRVREHKADAFVTVPTPVRQEYTLFSEETVLPVTFSLLTNKENSRLKQIEQIKTLPDLEPFRQVSYLGNGWAKLKLGKMDIIWGPTIERVLQLMDKNRYDIFVEATHAINYYIKQSGYGANLLAIPVPFKPVKFHLCVGRGSPFTKILPQFDETIRAMRADGALEKIYAKYR